jgi:hypothetical protein
MRSACSGELDAGSHAHDQKSQHAEMAPVVKKRQETAIEPGERTDRQDDGQHQKDTAPERLHADIVGVRQAPGRMERGCSGDESAKIERGRDKHYCVIDELGAIPLHRAEANAHRTLSVAAGGASAGGGAHNASAMTNPSPTARAKTGERARWTGGVTVSSSKTGFQPNLQGNRCSSDNVLATAGEARRAVRAKVDTSVFQISVRLFM